ncbi:hypothetical protein Dimus_038072 [Dionaea muscipula]
MYGRTDRPPSKPPEQVPRGSSPERVARAYWWVRVAGPEKAIDFPGGSRASLLGGSRASLPERAMHGGCERWSMSQHNEACVMSESLSRLQENSERVLNEETIPSGQPENRESIF